jgi:hypothetical protein
MLPCKKVLDDFSDFEFFPIRNFLPILKQRPKKIFLVLFAVYFSR